MKQLKVLVALVFAAAIAAPAMAAPTVTFSGNAKARYGMQYMAVDKNDAASLAFLSGLRGDDAAFASYYGLAAAGISGASLASCATANGFDVDKNSKELFVGLKNEQSARLNTKIEDGKFVASFGAEMDSTGVTMKDASMAYTLADMVTVTYQSVGLQGRWNADIFYVGDYTGESSLDFKIAPVKDMGNIFVTIMSDKSVSSAVKYENSALRTVPMTQFGYEYSSDALDATVGGVLDKYKGDILKDGYTGYMAFANVTYKMGKIAELEKNSMAFGGSAVYGQNTSRFAGMDPADMEAVTLDVLQACTNSAAKAQPWNATLGAAKGDLQGINAGLDANGKKKNSTVYGGLVYAAGSFWTGGLVGASFQYSVANLLEATDDFSAWKTGVSVKQYFAKNFYVNAEGGYETYSVVAGDKNVDKCYGYEAYLECGYNF